MKEIDFLKHIVKQAIEISKKDFIVNQKGNETDLVTSLDLEIEQFLIQEIKRNYPDFAIVSEEFNHENEITENCFIIDPIDGTINFANGLPLWGIQIACVKNGKTIASVISLPRINEFYWADETGAYLNDTKISVINISTENALYTIEGNNNLCYIQKMQPYSTHMRKFGAVCVSLAFLASGRIHGSVYRNDKPWDYAPGLFLCQMAGAHICDKIGFHAAASNQALLDILETVNQ